MLGTYYLCKKYKTTESIKTIEAETENKYKRRLYECKICTEKERYIIKRDSERLEIECVISESLPYNQELRVDKLYPKKKTIHLKTKHSNELGLCKRSYFEGFTNLG
ncbi:hypothetical protein AVEN_209765-1 [Araneus ventricosus]|uniref:Uncharacterized protein n=1 Tax=Araneus ventricosus TaxID=182803 RepID=A0A4Y2CCW9_ARAVE|nr:hypothetical protein AVEN_209765-1 [Araneus ventricosus]